MAGEVDAGEVGARAASPASSAFAPPAATQLAAGVAPAALIETDLADPAVA